MPRGGPRSRSACGWRRRTSAPARSGMCRPRTSRWSLWMTTGGRARSLRWSRSRRTSTGASARRSGGATTGSPSATRSGTRGPGTNRRPALLHNRRPGPSARRQRSSVRLLTTQSDERLALLARHGHDFAFEELVRRYREPLTRYLRRLLGDTVVASDALERGLIRAWASLLDGTTPVEVRSWLYGTVHSAAVGSLAARARLRPEQADRQEAETRALAAGLSQHQRLALMLAVRGYDPEAAV